MKALITGVNGFVGPYLKDYLLQNGHEVYGTDISSGKHVDLQVDLLDREGVLSLMGEVKPDLIFHLAAQSSVKLSWSKPELTSHVNVDGTRNLLDAVKEHVPQSKILLVSSADIYGPIDGVMKENSKLNPISPYGKSRVEQEKLALSYGLNLVVSRSFSHTGPGQSPVFVCSDFAKQIAEIENGGESLIMTGDLNVKRDFTDVRDIVRAYLMAVMDCKANSVFNICSGRVYLIKQVLDILIDLTDKDILIETDFSKIRENEIPVMEGDNSKFVKLTGWEPEIAFEDTLKDILDYWRKNQNFK